MNIQDAIIFALQKQARELNKENEINEAILVGLKGEKHRQKPPKLRRDVERKLKDAVVQRSQLKKQIEE